jgi:multidrug efflux system membrane fusion protein
LTRVQVQHFKGELTERSVSFSGTTAANRRVELRSEGHGKVVAVHKQKGSKVRAGELILELDKRDWPARVEQAKANFKQRQAQAQTLLANAQAELTAAQIQLDATQVRAPFAGVVDERKVEIGDTVQVNQPLAVVLDFNPYLVKGHVPERDAAEVRIGDTAYAELTGGTKIKGKVRFISSDANPNTRTFAVEVEIQSNNTTMVSGLTARIFIPQPAAYAFYLSPALLVLNGQGQLGLKGLDENNQVIFLPANLLKADDKGVWLYGLGQEANIITAGQGFVDYGQKVQPVFDEHNDAPKNNNAVQVE